MQHLRRGAARVQQLLFRYCLLVNNTDTGINPHIRVHYGRFIHRDTDIFVEKADYAWHGVVNYHAAGHQHSADYVNGMLRRTEFIWYFDTTAAGFNDFNVVIGINIYFLHTRLVYPFFQEREARHVLIQLGAQFLRVQSVYGIFAFNKILYHQFLENCCCPLGISFSGFCNRGSMVLGKIPLHILQYLVISEPFIGDLCKKNIVEVIHLQIPPRFLLCPDHQIPRRRNPGRQQPVPVVPEPPEYPESYSMQRCT